MNDLIQKSYDDIPYTSKSFTNTLPHRQASVLALLGFDNPKLENARILEIGCSFGGNIISFALAKPNAELIGIDLSEIQINEGNRIIKELGLKNIKLIHQNILDFKNDLGKFDYIICHGVFSWVPEEVRKKILTVIKENLKENGSAVISYNTYPGWKNIEVLKDIMQFRAQSLKDKNIQIENNDMIALGKGALEFLKEFSNNDINKNMIEDVLKKDAYYIYHEYFEIYNQPIYLYNFSKLLNEFGLKHICDTDIAKSFPVLLDKNLEEAINNECGNDQISKEQYYDYMYNRQFRISLITHKENMPENDITSFYIKNLEKLYIRGTFKFDVEKNKYFSINNLDFPEEYNNLLKLLDESFPNLLSTKEIAQKLGVDITDTYRKILELIYKKDIEFYTENIKIKEDEKIKLSDSYRKLFEYFYNTPNPVITFSNFAGTVTSIERLEVEYALKFDGTKTTDDIIEILIEEYKKGNVILNNSEIKIEDIAKNYINKIAFFIVANFMNI